MSPRDSLDQKSSMQTVLDNFSGRENMVFMVWYGMVWYMVFHRFITARQAGGECNHEWMLRVETLSDGVANDQQHCVWLAMAMVITGLKSNVVKLSILSKQEWTWEAPENFIRLKDNARSAVETIRRGNSYPDELRMMNCFQNLGFRRDAR